MHYCIPQAHRQVFSPLGPSPATTVGHLAAQVSVLFSYENSVL